MPTRGIRARIWTGHEALQDLAFGACMIVNVQRDDELSGNLAPQLRDWKTAFG